MLNTPVKPQIASSPKGICYFLKLKNGKYLDNTRERQPKESSKYHKKGRLLNSLIFSFDYRDMIANYAWVHFTEKRKQRPYPSRTAMTFNPMPKSRIINIWAKEILFLTGLGRWVAFLALLQDGKKRRPEIWLSFFQWTK